MKFEDVVLVGLLLVLYAIASRDTEFIQPRGASQTASLVYKGAPAADDWMVRTRHMK